MAAVVFLAMMALMALPTGASRALGWWRRHRARRAPVVPPATTAPAAAAAPLDPVSVDAEAVLVRRLVAGDLDRGAYQSAMQALAAADDVRQPLAVPADPGPSAGGDRP